MSAPSLPVDPSAARLFAAADAYAQRFGQEPNVWIVGVSDQRMAATLEQAVATGQPIPADYDWYTHLQPDAVA
ncbi:hypothetical protein VITFI_CDS0608 [Vitreoscilla filiformis]|jgi:hypothetical protein|uniref:Uncharacterized protein n=1 Tax=Vitreoscilla filiformis TaxID=63 RepID=A0A221KC34_VITFI|nr:hypothetical protein [Vitreoscilla filiformis]ASM76387.1 hypothetical protein VITFI_CDS0608 [Vitreoscilla filiformis]